MSSSNRAGSPRRRPGLLALTAMLAAAAAACDADRETLISPVGDAILKFNVGPDAARGVPGGTHSIDAFALGAVDPTRGTEPFGGPTDFHTDEASFFTGCPNECEAFEFPARTGSQDPRVPALEDAGGLVQTAITPTALFGDPLWVLHTGGVLQAGEEHFVTLERLATTVNGALDAVVRHLDNDEFGSFRSNPSDPPDELVPLGGAIGTTFGANPYIIGSFDPADGTLPNAGFDGGGNDDFVATNAAESFDLPRYNYLVVYRGDPRAGGVPVARAQFGVDLDPSGQPIVASYAPFPTAPVASLGDLLSLECCAGRAGTITVELANVAQISGVYQFWLTNVATGELLSAPGTLTVLEPDENGDLQEVEVRDNVRSFAGGAGQVFRFSTDDARAGVTVGGFTHVFVSIESAEASAPSISQPIWTEFTEVDPADPADAFGWQLVNDANTAFGTFDLGDEPVAWAPGGFGEGAFTGEEFGTADLLRVRLRNLPLPPVGYFYEGFLLTNEGTEASAGELSTEFEEGFRSLREVDVDRTISAQVAPDRIVESAVRATLQEVGTPFPVFDEFVVKLRPKAGVGTGPTVAVGGPVPDGIKAREGSD